jgi:hypothetical protein
MLPAYNEIGFRIDRLRFNQQFGSDEESKRKGLGVTATPFGRIAAVAGSVPRALEQSNMLDQAPVTHAFAHPLAV